MALASDDPEAQARLAAFRQALQDLGWSAGHNVQFDYRWGVGDFELNRKNAAELVGLCARRHTRYGHSNVRAVTTSNSHSADRFRTGPRPSRRRHG